MKQFVAFVLALLASISMAFAAVNVNTATQMELQTLNGIGPVKAKAIIDYRAKHGTFKSIDEIDNVPGIGKGTMSRIQKDVTLTGTTSVAAETKGSNKGSAGAKDAKDAKAGSQVNGKADAKDARSGKPKADADAKARKDPKAAQAGKTAMSKER